MRSINITPSEKYSFNYIKDNYIKSLRSGQVVKRKGKYGTVIGAERAYLRVYFSWLQKSVLCHPEDIEVVRDED